MHAGRAPEHLPLEMLWEQRSTALARKVSRHGIGKLPDCASRATRIACSEHALPRRLLLDANRKNDSAIPHHVPFQLAADGALSRAVWWHNARYTSSAPGVR